MENAKNQHDERKPTYVGLSPSELEEKRDVGFDHYTNHDQHMGDFDEGANQVQSSPVKFAPGTDQNGNTSEAVVLGDMDDDMNPAMEEDDQMTAPNDEKDYDENLSQEKYVQSDQRQ